MNQAIQRITRQSARERLRNRHALHRLAHDLARVLDSHHALGLGRALAGDLARTLDRVVGNDIDYAVQIVRAVTGDLASTPNVDLDAARDRVRDLVRTLDRELARGRVHVRASDRALARERERALNRDFDLNRVLELDRSITLVLAFVLTLESAKTDDVAQASEKVKRAADDFQGADLRKANLEDADLNWLRWDEHTVWPGGWGERMRNASVEKPAGSGRYTVLPAFDNDHATIPTPAGT